MLQQQVNAYHLDEGLLFQFILSEMLRVSHELPSLLEAHQHYYHSARTVDSANLLLNSMAYLAGVHQDYKRLFTWNHDEGSLTKLRKYCTCFNRVSLINDKDCMAMQRHANFIWLLSIQFSESFILENSKKKQTSSSLLLQKERSQKNIHLLFASFAKLNHLIAKILSQFSADENVIFFVIRHARELDAIWGQDFILKLMQKIYVGGLEEALDFLILRYTKRGFNNLLPIISTYMASLCHDKFTPTAVT